MRNLIVLSLLIFAFVTSGCVMHHPQTAEEFRQALPGSFMAKVDTSEVNRPFKKVARSFKKMGPKCLNKRITSTSTTHGKYGGQTQRLVTDYKATVKVHKNKAELHLQKQYVSGVKVIGNMPAGGFYILVADAERVGKKKTKVTIYTASVYDNLIKAVKSWAKGKTLCPDLTQ